MHSFVTTMAENRIMVGGEMYCPFPYYVGGRETPTITKLKKV